MKAVPIEATNAATPVTQVIVRRPRQAAIQNFPHRWITMNMKNSSTLQRWSEFTKWPTDETCHQAEPPTVSTMPDPSTSVRAASVSTPNT